MPLTFMNPSLKTGHDSRAKPFRVLAMQGGFDPATSVLHAQVRKAGPNHGHDEEGNIRPKAHPANISTVYLGDIASTLLKVIPGLETPKMEKRPGFNEQSWKFSANSGDLRLTIESKSYWGFGLITKCYFNTITLDGPLETRSRIIFDLAAALPHNPWEFSMNGSFVRKIGSIRENEEAWKSHLLRAREDLSELIEAVKDAKGDSNEIEIARNALADDNAPGVMRALARLEADSIDVDVEDVDPDGAILDFSDEIPLVDLTSEEE